MKRKNKHAQALGKLGGKAGKGIPKRIGPDEIGRRRIRLAEARKLRWRDRET